MQSLGQREQPRRAGGPVEPGEAQPPDVDRDRLAELRAVGDVVGQPGDDDHGQRHEQDRAEHRGQPRSAQRAAPGPGPTQARRRVAFESAPQPRGEAVGGILDLAAGLVTASHRQFLLPSDLLYMIEPPALNRDHPVGAPGHQGHDGERRVGRVGDQRRGLRVDLAALRAEAAAAAVLAEAAAAAVLAVAAAAAVLAVAEPALVMATGPTRTAMPGRRPRRNTSPLPLTGCAWCG